MAECKIRLINDNDDDHNDEKAFISSKQFPSYGSSSKSDAAPSDTHQEFFIQHLVYETDTLNSVALKYDLKASLIKRTNKLWNDNIFLCKFLFIPISNVNEYENKDYKIVSKKDILKGIPKSKSLGYFDPPPNNFSDQHNHYNPESIRSNDEERLENVDCLKNDDINQISAQDYFKKFDSSLAKIKKNVEKLEKQNRSPSSIELGPHQHTSPEGLCNHDNQPPITLFYSSASNSSCEKRIREKFEKIEDEMFQL